MGKSNDKKRNLPRGITQRPNGLYMARYMFNGEKYTLYDRSLTQLKKKLVDLKSNLEHGTYVAENRTKLNAWFDIWLKDFCEKTKKRTTTEQYKKTWDARIRNSKLGNTELHDLRPEQIQNFLNGLTDKYSCKYIHHIKVTLSQPITAAYKMQKIKNPLMDFITEPKGLPTNKREALTKAEQEIFKEYIKGSYLETFFLTALYTGMRSGELRGLQWADIDYKNNVINVQRTLHEKSGKFRLDTPKTAAGFRTIPITPQLKEVLKKQQAFYKALGGNILKLNNTDYVFTVGNNKPIAYMMSREEIKRILDNIHADNKEFRDTLVLHELRHTFCTNCAMAGMPPKVLQKIMGHSDISETFNCYTHIEELIKTEEMQKIAAYL